MKVRFAFGDANDVFEDAKQIRRDVFINEQDIDPELEFDHLDADKVHYVGYDDDGQPVTTARIMMLAGNRLLVQRVATEKDARGNGYARALMQSIIDDARNSGVAGIELHAQLSAKDFYSKLGFEPVGEVFTEAEIEHQKMTIDL